MTAKRPVGVGAVGRADRHRVALDDMAAVEHLEAAVASETFSSHSTRVSDASAAGIQPTLPLPASGLTTPSQRPGRRTTHSACGEPNSVRVASLA